MAVKNRGNDALSDSDSPSTASAVARWFESELGRNLLEAEREQVKTVMPGVFGYHLLQIGVFSDASLCDGANAGHRFLLLPRVELGMPEEAVVGGFDRLPFANDCIDAVVLHHALDFAESPHQLLREAARVLRPGGKLVVVSFNPVSFWGVFRWWRRRKAQPPWQAHFIGRHRLNDWLALLGLGRERTLSGFYRPPITSQAWMRRLGFLERWGARYLRNQGAFLVTIASKETLAGVKVGRGWRQRLAMPLVRPALPRAETEAARVGPVTGCDKTAGETRPKS
ncbi:class I SAM-dependent methyltransferase [Motiliproteus sp. SC1-56]|uniref:class I SAM-dependent methyltransferase n=1 Tax=Motiliproteus sp. SC1-56 TaxID=2799565 RepID=UPI001A8D48F9|nr:class I SAM-dependent methyltransferase [Motiliproteus sp. SC1-56]